MNQTLSAHMREAEKWLHEKGAQGAFPATWKPNAGPFLHNQSVLHPDISAWKWLLTAIGRFGDKVYKPFGWIKKVLANPMRPPETLVGTREKLLPPPVPGGYVPSYLTEQQVSWWRMAYHEALKWQLIGQLDDWFERFGSTELREMRALRPISEGYEGSVADIPGSRAEGFEDSGFGNSDQIQNPKSSKSLDARRAEYQARRVNRYL